MVIAFEGHDGSGKTTLIELLQSDLESLNRNVVSIKCPSEERKLERQLIDDSNDLKRSFEFYLKCCIDTSLKIMEYKAIMDFILLDRYYFSTIVSHKSRGFDFDPIVFESLEKVDLKIEVRTNENIRRQRVIEKREIQSHDMKTFEYDLIQKANNLYSILGFIQIENNHSIEHTLAKTKEIIKEHYGEL